MCSPSKNQSVHASFPLEKHQDMKLPRPEGRGFCLAAVLRTPVRKIINIFI
jgi:hypothetical protein